MVNHDRLIPNYRTYTTPETHEIIARHFDLLPSIYHAKRGPRYCPSLESKIVRFANRSRHQVWLEPEGLTSNSVYPNGLSTGFPAHVQEEIIHSIPGLEKAIMLRPGYGIEYDYVDPRQLDHSLEVGCDCRDLKPRTSNAFPL